MTAAASSKTEDNKPQAPAARAESSPTQDESKAPEPVKVAAPKKTAEPPRTPRLQPSNLALAESGAFQMHHEARTDRPLDELDLAEFFANLQANLFEGDRVTVCRYEDNKWKRLFETRDARVVEKTVVDGVKRTVVEWCEEGWKSSIAP